MWCRRVDEFNVWRNVSRWSELLACESDLDDLREEWVFRGHSNVRWSLNSTLQRATSGVGIRGEEVSGIEQDSLLDFWRYYDLHSVAPPPSDDDTLGWLSLMRHYGGPTRLLDFTRSLFIAAYFALEDAEEEAVIWAISKTWLSNSAQKIILEMGGSSLWQDWGNRVGDAFDRIFFTSCPYQFVAAASPAKMHERLAIQQGIFLCPGDVRVSFLENLRRMKDNEKYVRPILISGEKQEILLKLMRIGIDRSSLFPGLEGFAQSLRSKILVFQKLRIMEQKKARLGPNLQWSTKRTKRMR